MPVRHVDDALLTAPGERGALVRRLHAGGRGVSPTETEGLPTPVRVPGASNLGRARILFPRRRTSCVLCYPLPVWKTHGFQWTSVGLQGNVDPIWARYSDSFIEF